MSLKLAIVFNVSCKVGLQLGETMKQGRQCTYERNNEARSPNHCCRKKAVRITYSECVSVALGIQHAKRMRRIILSSVVCPDLPF